MRNILEDQFRAMSPELSEGILGPVVRKCMILLARPYPVCGRDLEWRVQGMTVPSLFLFGSIKT